MTYFENCCVLSVRLLTEVKFTWQSSSGFVSTHNPPFTASTVNRLQN